MNLGRVKTFLIVLFLGINIFLIASHYYATRFYINDKTIDDTISIIKDYGITVDKDTVINHTVNLKNIETNNVVYSDAFIKKNKSKRFSVNGNRFQGAFTSRGILGKSDAEIEDTVISHLEEYGFSKTYMDIGSIKHSDGLKKFTIRCKVKKYYIFDNVISVTVAKDSFRVKGMWYEPANDNVSMNSRSRKTVYITSVLMGLAENEDAKANLPFKVTDIDYGYVGGTIYGDGGHVTATALPYYRIKDNKGNVYYYDASNGTYFK